MPLSETRARELAELEPPRSIERIVRFLQEFTLRLQESAGAGVPAEAGNAGPIGQAGQQAAAFSVMLAGRPSAFLPAGVRGTDAWLTRLMRTYQLDTTEVQNFTCWLVKWNDKRAAMETISPEEFALRNGADAAVGLAERAPVRVYRRDRTGRTVETENAASEGTPYAAPRRTVTMSLPEGETSRSTEESPVRSNENTAGRARSRISQYDVERRETPSSVRAARNAMGETPAAETAERRPDVLTRAWQGGRGTELPTPGADFGRAFEMPAVTQRANRVIWAANLSMGAVLAENLRVESKVQDALTMQAQNNALRSPLSQPIGEGQRSYLDFNLSRPPMPQTSWTGQAPPAPAPQNPVAMPTVTHPFVTGAASPPKAAPKHKATPPPIKQKPVPQQKSSGTDDADTRPADARDYEDLQDDPIYGVSPTHTLPSQEDPYVLPISARPGGGMLPGAARYLSLLPLTAMLGSSASAQGIGAGQSLSPAGLGENALLSLASRSLMLHRAAAPLASNLVSRPGGGLFVPGVTNADTGLNASGMMGTMTAERTAAVTASGQQAVGTLFTAKAQNGLAANRTTGLADTIVGRQADTAATLLAGNRRTVRMDSIAPAAEPPASPAMNLPGMQNAATAQDGKPNITPEMGQITLLAPPLRVASRDAEGSGVATEFDWSALASGGVPLDAGAMARLQQALPAGAQAIYPAIPKERLPGSAVNLQLAPALLQPLMQQGYGAKAAQMAGRAAQMAQGDVRRRASAAPLSARIVPGKAPMGQNTAHLLHDPTAKQGTGALARAGRGQATRGGALDFLGMPVRLAPSLSGNPELSGEVAARSGLSAAPGQQAARPDTFAALRNHLLPSAPSVTAETDRAAWNKAAPEFGLRDSRPTTLLAPDARARFLSASAPLPQMNRAGGGPQFLPRPGAMPALVQRLSRPVVGNTPPPPAAIPSLLGSRMAHSVAPPLSHLPAVPSASSDFPAENLGPKHRSDTGSLPGHAASPFFGHPALPGIGTPAPAVPGSPRPQRSTPASPVLPGHHRAFSAPATPSHSPGIGSRGHIPHTGAHSLPAFRERSAGLPGPHIPLAALTDGGISRSGSAHYFRPTVRPVSAGIPAVGNRTFPQGSVPALPARPGGMTATNTGRTRLPALPVPAASISHGPVSSVPSHDHAPMMPTLSLPRMSRSASAQSGLPAHSTSTVIASPRIPPAPKAPPMALPPMAGTGRPRSKFAQTPLVVQRSTGSATPAKSASEQTAQTKRDALPNSAEKGTEASEIMLFANEVYALLKRRFALDAERAGIRR